MNIVDCQIVYLCVIQPSSKYLNQSVVHCVIGIIAEQILLNLIEEDSLLCHFIYMFLHILLGNLYYLVLVILSQVPVSCVFFFQL